MTKSMFVLVAVLALALAAQAGANANNAKSTKDPSVTKADRVKTTKDPSVTKADRVKKGPNALCKAKYGTFDSKTKECDETNAAAMKACAEATPPGKWLKNKAKCQARTVPPFKVCKAAYGAWNNKTNECDKTNADAKKTCLTVTNGRWNNKNAVCKPNKAKKTTTPATATTTTIA